MTKYVIKYKGTHVFNPSNIGLVVAFLVLGSTRVEPLDFWWAPLNVWMITAYAVIIGGGLMITRRLRLFELAATYWVTLVIGVGILAGSGHCMTANWSFTPVCGADFWRVIVTSPEVLIFLFFMITDPKTTPSGRVGRVVFAFLVGVLSTLLMAPQVDEWGTKVGLLSSLVVVCAARPILDRLVPEPRSAADDLRAFGSRLATGGKAGVGVLGTAARVGVIVLVFLGLGAGIVVAGTPARGTFAANTADVLDRVPHEVDPSTFPAITVDQDVSDWNHEIEGDGARAIVLTLAENLELENQALLRRDASILPAVDHGDRLSEMQDARPRPRRGRRDRRVPLPVRQPDDAADRAVRRAERAQSRPRRPGHRDRGDLRRRRQRGGPPRRAVRPDVRDAPRDGRPLAERRRAAGRRMIGMGDDPAEPG